MRKVIKILVKLLSIIILLSIFLPVSIALLFNVGAVQNYVADRLAVVASDFLETRVEIGSIDIDLFSRVRVEDFYVEDYQQDTLLYARRAEVAISSLNILREGVVLTEAKAEGARFFLRELPSGEINVRPIVLRMQKPNPKGNFRLLIEDIEARDAAFLFERLEHRNPEYGIDYYNMYIHDINAKIDRLSVAKGGVEVDIAELSAKERSGFRLDDLACELDVERGLIRFTEFSASTPTSSIYLPLMTIQGEDWTEYKYYIDKVVMHGKIEDTTISTDDLGYFAPGLRKWNVAVSNADAEFRGVVRDFEGELYRATICDSTKVNATFHITGLPQWRTSNYVIGIKELHTTSEDVLHITDNILPQGLPEGVRQIVDRVEWADVRATVGGRLSSYRVVGNVSSGVGDISTDVVIAGEPEQRYNIAGYLQTEALDLGRLLAQRSLHKLDTRVNINGSLGDELSGGVIAGVGAHIAALGFGGYTYSDIDVEGRVDGNLYYAELNSRDPNMEFDLFAEVDYNDELPRYGLSMALHRADLNALGVNRRDSISSLSANIGVELFGKTLNEMDGYASIADINYLYPEGELSSDHIMAEAKSGNGIKSLNVETDFFDLQYQSRSTYDEVFGYLYNSLKTYIPLLYEEGAGRDANGEPILYSNDFTVLKLSARDNINDLFAAIAGGLFMAPDTEATLMLNPGTNLLSLQASSETLEYAGMLMANYQLDINNRSDSLSMWLNSSGIYMGSRLVMPNFSITGGAQQNRVSLSAGFRDRDDNESGLLGLRAQFHRSSESKRRSVHIDIMPSYYTTATQQWRLHSRGIDIDSTHINIRNLVLTRPGQRLVIDGVASKLRSDSLRLTLNNFDLSPLSAITSRVGYEIRGRSNGFATVKSALQAPEIEANIDLDSIGVNEISVPPQNITSNWDFERNRARVIVSDKESADTVIRGYYQPANNRYYAQARIDNVSLKLISPFLKGIISDIEGTADVEANILGQGRKATLNGYALADSIGVTVDYLNVRYTAPRGEVNIVDSHIIAKDVAVYDGEGNKGDFSVDLNLNHLSNVTYDIDIGVEDMLVLDTDAKSNDLFYGHVYASGSASFAGDKRGLKMDIEATSGDNSHFFMPLSGKSDVAYADFVKFREGGIEEVDTTAFLTRRMMAYERKMRPVNTLGSMMDIDMTFNVLPNTEIQLVIDPTVGDIIKAKGNGQLTMHVVPKANIFEMRGDYTISEGTYLFTLQNIWNKKFTVVPASSIHWTGDPLGAMLNIDAVYSTKASLKPLIGNSMQGIDTSRAVPVDCYIKLTDELMSPTVTFDVQVPNVAPEIQTVIQSALNDQQAIATQMFWLLAANTFAAEDTGAMGATLTATTGFELLSNQLSNWLSGDNYNIVLRYRPRTELTGDEVDVGFSKGWLDNRLIVELEGGYLSDASVQSRQNASNFVGEAFITWLIDPDGTLRFKGFTQTIDRYGENQGMQETGIGLYYSESFNTFSDLAKSLRNKFNNKERREERRAKKEARRAVKQEKNDTEDTPSSEPNVVITGNKEDDGEITEGEITEE